MIVWRKSEPIDQAIGIPPWLEGCPEVTTFQDLVWVGSGLVRPDVSSCSWVSVGGGWDAAKVLGKAFDPMSYRRRVDWSLGVMVTDARGCDWWLPSIIHPQGGLAVACASRLDENGNWVREPVNDLQRSAVDACNEVIPHVHDLPGMGTNRCCELLCHVLGAVYHLNAATIAKLGLIDDVLIQKGLAMACGRLDISDPESFSESD